MVKPEYRKNGIGKMERNLKKDGIRKIFLVVYNNNNKTDNNFWERNGYNKRKDLNYRNKRIKE